MEAKGQRQILRRARSCENEFRVAVIQSNVGAALLEQGRVDEARDCLVESPRLYAKRGGHEGTARCPEGLAEVANRHEPPALAAHLCAAAARLRERVSAPLPPAERRRYERTLATANTTLLTPESKAAWTLGQEAALDRVVALAVAQLGG